MIHPDIPGQTKWWNQPNEAELRLKGWKSWHELYDYQEDIIYGHSTCAQPIIRQNLNKGKTIGIDLGSCFGGSICACVYYEDKSFIFITTKAEEIYCKNTTRNFWEK